MLRSMTRRLFPLHLAPIDNFFLMDDRPDYPMTFVSNLFFEGNFQPNALELALDDALQLHPLLNAVIEPAKQGKLCWVKAEEIPAIDFGSLDDEIDLSDRQVDLQRESGVKIWVRQGIAADGKRRAKLVFQFHHACSDGTGAHRFIGDLLAVYGIRTADPDDPMPTVAKYDDQLLKSRRFRLQEKFGSGRKLTLVRRTLSQGMDVFGRRITPLQVHPAHAMQERDDVASAALPGVVSHSFDRNEHKALREAAGRLGGTLNDLLLAETFCAMQTWNRQQGVVGPQRLRIMMPSDLRDKRDFAMPAANMTSYNFITRRLKPNDDFTQLVRSIRDETALIKHENRGRQFIDSIMAARAVPGLLSFLLSRGSCLSTITVSHMGDPTRRFQSTFPRKAGKIVCGDVILEDLIGVSPLRPQTRAALSIITLYRGITLCVRCDPLNMSVADAKSLLEMMVTRMRKYVEQPVETPPLETCSV